MKKLQTLGLSITLGMLLSSCFSAATEDDLAGEEGYQVTFHCIEFENLPFETRSTEISDLATRIDLAVFDSEGTRLKNISQESSEESFGTISFRLAEGRYTVVAVAHSGAKKATLTSPSKITFDGNKLTDTFLYSQSVTVAADKAYDLDMDRCVAMVRFIITDDVPSEVASLMFYYTGGSSTLDATTGKGCVASRQTEYRTPDVSDSHGNTVYEIYTFPRDDSETLKLTIKALSASDETVCEKVIDNVPVAVNEISQYTGQFFAGASSQFNTENTFYTNDVWTTREHTF